MDWGDGQRQLDEGSVVGPPHGLEVLDALVGSNAAQHVALFMLQVGGNEHAEQLADGLLGRVVKDAFSGRVP